MPRPPTGLPPRQPPGTRRLLRSVSVKPFTEHIRRGQVTPEPPCNYRVVSMFVQLSDRRPQTEDRMRRTDRASRQARLAALLEGGGGAMLLAAAEEDDLDGVPAPLGQVCRSRVREPGHRRSPLAAHLIHRVGRSVIVAVRPGEEEQDRNLS